MIPLFEHFPNLEEKLPYVSLCKLPTPIQRLEKLGQQIGLDHLYIKQDGLTASPFGGNKVRKLEFLLGEALRRGAKEVMTFGFAGSNHALATAVYAKQLGLKSISMLIPQHNAHYVRRNLLMSRYYEAELHHYPNKTLLTMGTSCQLLRHRLKRGRTPYVILPGGSTPIGAVGFVNAAFELKKQVDQKEIPEPDYIYAALGSAGTVVGLMIGLKVVKMKSKIFPIRVVDHHFIDKNRVLELFSGTAALLHSLDSLFPRLDAEDVDAEMDIRDRYLGNGYARFTERGMEAVALMREIEGIQLDGTYTGKTFAALMEDAREGRLKGKKVLFWNTLNAHELSGSIGDIDYHQLPKSFHCYFEKDVQPLDKV